MPSATATDVIEALSDIGFEYIGRENNGCFRLSGQLITGDEKTHHPCEVLIAPDLLEPPKIVLTKNPRILAETLPHIGPDGSICYIASGTVVLDIFDPVGQTLACIERASAVLSSVLNGEMVKDLTEEFFAYWSGEPCFVDFESKSLGIQDCLIGDRDGRKFWFITDSPKRTSCKALAMGFQVEDARLEIYRVKTGTQPRPLPTLWPPETVKDVLSWQAQLDSRCRKKILQRLQDGKNANANGVLIIVESPLLTYGFAVRYMREPKEKRTKSHRHEINLYNSNIIPLSILKLDDRYISQRAIPHLKTLAGKKIVIIGCGTIGSFLVEMLIKLGAGTIGGLLTVVDMEYLFPQNVGRHRLGIPSLLQNKASAIVNEIQRTAPTANIRALPVDIRQAEIGKADLIIDSTGEENLGHWLCKKYLPGTPMLTIWIEGPGVAVRGLLKKNASQACYRCLWHSNRRGELKSVQEDLPNIMAGQGCEGMYVPFPATVSIKAAVLGAEMVLDWANDKEKANLRTVIIDHSYHSATNDCSPAIDKDCPICNS